MSTEPVSEPQSRWLETQKHVSSFASLQRAVKYNGHRSPCLAGCRSVCWKAFLLFQSDCSPIWSHSLAEHRSTYSSLRDHFLKYIDRPEELNSVTVDPLANDPTSPWNTVRQDELIRQEILQDVRRLPDEPFYHQDHVQAMILDVLFIYCKLNPDIGYRQGMHELLAPIVCVVSLDAVDPATRAAATMLEPVMADMLDSTFVEHDSYTLFSKLMSNCRPFYELESPSSSSSSASGIQSHVSTIVEKSRHIHEGCLSRIDPELAIHLKDIEILPQIFLIRWIRLLFGREFPFEQQLILWDTIFAIDPNLQLVDLICVAMLLRIRWELLEADYSSALQTLLKYPSPKDPHGPHTFVDDAYYLSTHMTPSGGSTLVAKYSGKRPAEHLGPSSTTPSTGPLFPHPFRPGGSTLASIRAPIRAPLPHPSRLFNQQDDMKTIFSGAAKNVLERGEKLGINQAVRDAVGDIRRGWSEARSQLEAGAQRSPHGDPTGALIAALERRNRQLALMLGEAFTELKTLVDEERKGGSAEQPPKKHTEAIEMVAAKVHFVKVHLEDSALEMEYEPEETQMMDGVEGVVGDVFVKDAHREAVPVVSQLASKGVMETPRPPLSSPQSSQPQPTSLNEVISGASAMDIDTEPLASTDPLSSAKPTTMETKAPRPEPRTNLSQSSFSWMLEDPDSATKNAGEETHPSSTSATVVKMHKRGTSEAATASRERNAFLFGEVTGDEEGSGGKVGSEDIFGLTPITKGRLGL